MTQPEIRPMVPADFAGVVPVIEATDLFPADMLPAIFEAPPRFGAPPAIWRVAEAAGAVAGLAYAEPETFTEDCWNMRAIAVSPEVQDTGIGTALVTRLEADIRLAGGGVLIVDTAGLAAFDRARGFYRARGYAETARIADYWAPGVDKVSFVKKL